MEISAPSLRRRGGGGEVAASFPVTLQGKPVATGKFHSPEQDFSNEGSDAQQHGFAPRYELKHERSSNFCISLDSPSVKT